MRKSRVAVVGAGVAGLVAALELAARGVAVTVVERAYRPGGKLRPAVIGDAEIDAGPTVFTMRPVFEEIFASAGSSLDAHLTLRPAETLARHAWSEGERLDLFTDPDRSADAIGTFAGAGEAHRYRLFSARAERVYRALERPFIFSQRPNPISLVGSAGVKGLAGLWEGAPFSTLWHELGDYFHDPRLRQLFGRYATYCGSSPFQAAAILMLVAHVEREGVWLVEGGMRRIAEALAGLAATLGAQFRYGEHVEEVTTAGGRVTGIALSAGERLEAEAVVVNADAAAVAGGLLGGGIGSAVPGSPPERRSLSALTWTVRAKTSGFPLLRHNVFFSGNYQAEFDDIFRAGRLPSAPTVYVCAQDRESPDGEPAGAERLLILVNAPPTGDRDPFDAPEVEQCETRTFGLLARCGLHVARSPETTIVTTPADFHRLYPGTGGALYGQASHGWQASFRRPGSRTRIPGLYLAGGSTHPGPGVPMAALSGRLAAASVLEDLASTSRSIMTATSGGMSTRSATMRGTA